MICISIGRQRHKMVKAEHRALAEQGAELVELRLDWITHMPQLSRLLDNRPTPAIVTCRRPSDQGKWKYSEEERITLLRAAIVAGADYVDLEDDVAAQIPRYGPTKRIISRHDFEKTPDNLEEIHTELCRWDPDVVKLVTMAHSPGDSIRMLKLVAAAEVPTVGFCMGEYGVISRILCGRYGAPFTYASYGTGRELAPGQLSYMTMRDVYRYDQIDEETAIYGVLGDPVGHSLSPAIHNAAFRQLDLNGVYLPFRVPADGFSQTLDEFEWLGVEGYSVTIPHKEAAIERASHWDGPVRDIGAANTLFRDAGGAWHATNTDYDAALASLRLGLETSMGGDALLQGKRVLMLGAGGVARAVALGLVRRGAELTIANRTPERAHKLAETLGCSVVDWDGRTTAECDVLINCTSLGMLPNVEDTPFPADRLRRSMLVFDTVYNPETTRLIREAREQGCQTVTGLEMFVRQAGVQFQKFTGKPAPLELMRHVVRRELGGGVGRGE